ncbi:diguanylate cyclase domain-containing protein [Gallaecimonas pentaromativorans]|uniref:sensor domain-containing diguanylate cyclase n=1 Tax=Gallaecimonas pentaromativorans TaxID=584787 RepID=UPI003A8DC8D4
MRHTSLRVQIAVGIALVAICISWVFTFFTIIQTKDDVRTLSGHLLTQNARILMNQLDMDMEKRLQFFEGAASLPLFRPPIDGDAVVAFFDNVERFSQNLDWIGLLDAEGKVLYATDPWLVGQTLTGLDLLHLPGNANKPVPVVNPAWPSRQAHPYLQAGLTMAIRGPDQQTLAILAGQFSWDWAKVIEQALALPRQDSASIEPLLLDKAGVVMVGSGAQLGDLIDGQQLAALKKRGWQLFHDDQGQAFLYALTTSHYHSPGWQVLLRQPVAEIAEQMSPLLLRLLGMTVLASLLAAGLGWWLSGWISRPITRIARAANRLSAGIPASIPKVKGVWELQMLSDSLCDMVTNLSKHQSALGVMETLALKDALTGLPNRAALLRFMQGQVDPLVFLYLDLDGFKAINDNFGHQAGDLVLKEVAERLIHNTRDGDLAVRLGGDEFLVVLQLGPHTQPVQVAERILAAVNEPMESQWGSLLVGCSIGGAYWPKDNDDPKTVVSLADQALYTAKSQGKGRVCFYRFPGD